MMEQRFLLLFPAHCSGSEYIPGRGLASRGTHPLVNGSAVAVRTMQVLDGGGDSI